MNRVLYMRLEDNSYMEHLFRKLLLGVLAICGVLTFDLLKCIRFLGDKSSLCYLVESHKGEVQLTEYYHLEVVILLTLSTLQLLTL